MKLINVSPLTLFFSRLFCLFWFPCMSVWILDHLVNSCLKKASRIIIGIVLSLRKFGEYYHLHINTNNMRSLVSSFCFFCHCCVWLVITFKGVCCFKCFPLHSGCISNSFLGPTTLSVGGHLVPSFSLSYSSSPSLLLQWFSFWSWTSYVCWCVISFALSVPSG